MAEFSNLGEAVDEARRTLQDLAIGKSIHKTAEETISLLQQYPQIAKAKLLVESAVANDVPERESVDEHKLLEKIVQHTNEQLTIKNVQSRNKLDEFVFDNPKNELKLYYFNKMKKQLKTIKRHTDELKEIRREKQEVLKEISELKGPSPESVQKCIEHLENQGEEFTEAMNSVETPEYKAQLNNINKNIEKLNLVRFILVRLLSSGEIDGSKYLEFLKLLEKFPVPYSLEHFTKE